jgi:hypothetical protein
MTIAIVLLMLASAPATFTVLPVTSKQLAYEHEGRTVDSVRWRDRLGDHVVLFDESGEYPSTLPKEALDSEDARDASVHAYEYLDAGGKTTRVWTLEDFERGCEFDLMAEFVPGSVTITDLDADGVAEVTFQYSLTCTSDVSPITRKLIMREGKDKYAIRGTTRSKWYLEYVIPGKPDPAFEKAPPAFLKHATRQWEAFVDVDPAD